MSKVKFDNQVCVNCVYIDAMEPVCPYVNLEQVSLIDEVLVCTSFVQKDSSVKSICLFCKSEFELQVGCYRFCDECIGSLVKLEELLKSEFDIFVSKKWVSLIHEFQKYVLSDKGKV